MDKAESHQEDDQVCIHLLLSLQVRGVHKSLSFTEEVSVVELSELEFSLTRQHKHMEFIFIVVQLNWSLSVGREGPLGKLTWDSMVRHLVSMQLSSRQEESLESRPCLEPEFGEHLTHFVLAD